MELYVWIYWKMVLVAVVIAKPLHPHIYATYKHLTNVDVNDGIMFGIVKLFCCCLVLVK